MRLSLLYRENIKKNNPHTHTHQKKIKVLDIGIVCVYKILLKNKNEKNR